MHSKPPFHVAIIGGGPAGLMAAETIAAGGAVVTIYERMPSLGRKLLMAGRGGLNITHSESLPQFFRRYGAASAWMTPYLESFPPEAVQQWCAGLGQAVFMGSSGRVFPTAMKASPLLRAWLLRLRQLGVNIVTRAEWTGWAGEKLCFADGSLVAADAVVLALGGASWPRLGADGGWTRHFPAAAIAPLRPANCGFAVEWSAHFAERFAGQPLKRIALRCGGESVRGELMLTKTGIEGGAIYAISAAARDMIAAQGAAVVEIDLRPDMDANSLNARLGAQGSVSLSNHLRKRLSLSPAAIGLVQEALHGGNQTPLATLIKALPLRLFATSGLARAISTAGGLKLDELDENLMLRHRPGIFAAGEMLDWEAPTGGYLLQACLATGKAAGQGVLSWLSSRA